MSKCDLSTLVRYTTGHAHLRRHNKLAGTSQPLPVLKPEQRIIIKDPSESDFRVDEEIRCRLCQSKDKEETPHHIITECPTLWRERWTRLGYYTYEGIQCITWNPFSLLGFINSLDLENKPN